MCQGVVRQIVLMVQHRVACNNEFLYSMRQVARQVVRKSSGVVQHRYCPRPDTPQPTESNDALKWMRVTAKFLLRSERKNIAVKHQELL